MKLGGRADDYSMELDFVEFDYHLGDWEVAEQGKEFPTAAGVGTLEGQFGTSEPRIWDMGLDFAGEEGEWASTEGSSLLTSPESLYTDEAAQRGAELRTEARIFEVRKRRERRYRERRRQKKENKAVRRSGYL